MIYGTSRVYSSATCDVGPNNIGNVSRFVSWENGEFNGVLIKYDGGNALVAGGSGRAISASIGFNAQNGCAVYGASSTVQPASVCFLACIKI